MGKSNLSQHEQYLQLLEKSIREISEQQNEVFEVFHQTLGLYELLDQFEQQRELHAKFRHALNNFNTTRNMTIRLFMIADNLRTTRLNFEKENSDKESSGWKIRTWWK